MMATRISGFRDKLKINMSVEMCQHSAIANSTQVTKLGIFVFSVLVFFFILPRVTLTQKTVSLFTVVASL